MDSLLAVVLVCAAGVAPAQCTRATATDITVSPARLPTDCLTGGLATAAHSLTVPPGGLVKVVCERRKAS